MIYNIKNTIKNCNITNDFLNKYYVHFQNFLDFNYEKYVNYKINFMPINTEEKIEYLDWVGVVDRIDKINDKIIIIDYKTTKGFTIEEYEDELLLYAWLVKHQKNITPSYIAIYFTENNNFIYKAITNKDIEENINILNEEKKLYEKAIAENKFPKQPGYYCKLYCPFYKVYCDANQKI